MLLLLQANRVEAIRARLRVELGSMQESAQEETTLVQLSEARRPGSELNVHQGKTL